MIDFLRQSMEGVSGQEAKVNRLREALQVLMLKIMFDRDAFEHLAFVGGTALRIIYDLRRFSEDLDFSLVKKQGYSFEKLHEGVLFELRHYNLLVEAEPKQEKVVQSSMVKFPGLLAEMGLSQIKGQKLAIRLEIDTNPPNGWKTVLTPVTRSYVFAVNSFDLPSQYATKLHACFFRGFTKGRDFYDLIWYLGKKAEPNFALLNNAIRQTEGKELHLGPGNFQEFMKEELRKVDWTAAKRDVERFLEDKSELKLFDQDVILGMMR